MIGFYILTKLSDVVCACIIIGVISTVASFISTVAFYTDLSYNYDDEEKQALLKHYNVKVWYLVCIISWLIATFLPTTKQAAFIWIAPQIVENGAVKDTVKNIPELTKLGTDYLKELLKEKIED